jgi:hypothetical protein
VPGMHVLPAIETRKTWMAGTSPAMTVSRPRAMTSPQPRPATTLAFYNFVALLEQPLAFAILALLLLLDVGAFFIGHDVLPAVSACTRTKTAFSFISKANSI